MRRMATLGVLAVAGALLGGCGQDPPTAGAPPTTSAPTSVAPTDGTGPTFGPTTSPSAPAGPAARVIALTVQGGQVTGETGRVEIPLGTPVTINVTSDVADELHVHGYDEQAQIPAADTGSVSFTADIPGVFEVELHESGKQLLQLQVS